MKVISLLQPWSQLMVTGEKLVETRSWNTLYRGPIFIHASGGLTKKMKDLGDVTPLDMASSNQYFRGAIINPNLMVFGRIIGMVEIVNTFKITNQQPPDEIWDKLTVKEITFGNYEVGRYMWLTKNFVQFTNPPIWKGAQGIRDATTGCRRCDRGEIPTNAGHLDAYDVQQPCYNMIKPFKNQ